MLTSVWGSDEMPTDPGMKQWRAETLPRQTWAHALRIACRAVADDQTGIVSRISICGACPSEPGEARDLLRLAEELSWEHDLKVWSALQDRLITISLEERANPTSATYPWIPGQVSAVRLAAYALQMNGNGEASTRAGT